jgi:lysyl-tRNA synthetase class 2
VRRAARVLAALGALAVVASASGWLYLLRGLPLPGPRVGEALPLDELAKRSSVPLLLFLGVWLAIGLVAGLIARAAGVGRALSAALLTLGVGAWTYLATGVSILIVRQVPAHEAFEATAHLPRMYVPPLVAALAGAVTGRARAGSRPWPPLVLAWTVAATGALGVLDAVLPERPETLLSRLAPERVHPLASALAAPLGLALLAVSRGLARRRRPAYQLTVALLLPLIALHVLHGFRYGALAAGLVLVALVARRQDFDRPGDPASRPRVASAAVLLAAGLYAYGLAALWINRMAADQPFTLPFGLRETTRALAGLTLAGSPHLSGGFGRWFPLSVFVAALAAATWLVRAWLAPWRYRLRQEAAERETARALVAAWGSDTLAPFALRADKSYFFADDGHAFLAYRVVGGVAIVSGDPIGDRVSGEPLVGRFIEFAHARGWRVAILGASEAWLELYRRQGLQALYHGDEAVIETRTFSLEGRAIRKVRQSVHRLENCGFRAEVRAPAEIDERLRDELEAIARAWRGSAPARGFTMALDALFGLEQGALFVIGRRPDGAPAGFLHFAVCRTGAALSLSSMPRLRDTPNGFNEWLVCETVAWAQQHGFERISLNFAPFAALLAPEARLSPLQRLERRALLALKGHFQLDNLLVFNRKFFPGWQRRFVVYERWRDLPRVGIAALAAEAYLPLAGRR